MTPSTDMNFKLAATHWNQVDTPSVARKFEYFWFHAEVTKIRPTPPLGVVFRQLQTEAQGRRFDLKKKIQHCPT
jgi:hypothetical protein